MSHDRFVFAVHVHPGCAQPGVGGTHDGRLVVRVRARAVAGAANGEVLTAIARALGVRERTVSFVRAGRSRDKVVAVVDSPVARERHQSLLATHDAPAPRGP